MAQLTNPQGEVTAFNLYDALNRLTKKTLANGVVEKHTFDDAGRETSIEYRTASNVLLASFVSTYDAAGNRLSVTEADGSVTTYAYDADDQLLSEQRTGTHPYLISYSYDALGNRTGKVEDGVATTYVYAAANRLTSEQTAGSVTTYGYDVLGQCTGQTQDGAVTLYGWNTLGQMVSVTAPDSSSEFYSYCGDGIRRTATDSAGTRLFIRDGQNILLEADENDITLRRYTHEGSNWGGLLSLYEGSTSRYYGFDGSANTRLLTDENSSVSDAYLYSAFGQELEVSGTSANPLRFGGEVGYYHDTMKRTYVRARHLDVGAGRWLSRDPIGFEGGDFNFYRYVGNNTVNRNDPSGLWEKDEVHGKCTEQWAKEVYISMGNKFAKFSWIAAQAIGQGASSLDDTLNSAAIPSNWHMHFNMADSPSREDTRLTYFRNQSYLAYNETGITPLYSTFADGMNTPSGYRRASKRTATSLSKSLSGAKNFGKGLHAIEDIYAHGSLTPVEHQDALYGMYVDDPNRKLANPKTTSMRRFAPLDDPKHSIGGGLGLEAYYRNPNLRVRDFNFMVDPQFSRMIATENHVRRLLKSFLSRLIKINSPMVVYVSSPPKQGGKCGHYIKKNPPGPITRTKTSARNSLGRGRERIENFLNDSNLVP